jgi:tetratricopeptide (TPR) repeat protein
MMNSRTPRSAAFYLIAAAMFLTQLAFGQLARMSTQFVARGEAAFLEISTTAGRPETMPIVPSVPGVVIEPQGPRLSQRFLPGRPEEYSFGFNVVSYEVGRHVIPPVEITVRGVKIKSSPIEFVVFDPNELEWSEITAGDRTYRYASSFRTLKPNPYEGETLATEIKIYIPLELASSVQDWGIPEFQRDGVASWRFEPTDIKGQVNLLGGRYISLGYPSTMSPTRTGKVGIGPATVRLITLQGIIDRFPRQVSQEIFLKVPKLELDARPLPEGAPEGFDNAIGQFHIEATASETEIREGDPISVDLLISGSGNLDTLRPPKLIDEKGWKVYDSTPSQRGDERREMTGAVTFRQFMRPLEPKSMIPPFRLVYFDPTTEEYESVSTETIPLRVLPSIAPPLAPGSSVAQALPVPLERMTDVLAVLRPASLVTPAPIQIPAWTGHVLGGLAALALIAKAFWMRIAPRLRKDPTREAKSEELQKLSKIDPNDDTGFLRAAGSFIERWNGENTSPELREILAERDAVAFRAEKTAVQLGRKRRGDIMKLLRTTAVAILAFISLGLAPTADAQEDIGKSALEAYDAAKYDEAIKLWLSAGKYEDLSPDVLYNIGNASYRLGSSGHAALYYRRALARDPSHEESLQNLRFLERKNGSITLERQNFQYTLAKIPLPIWKAAAWTGAWICVLALLVFPATRSSSRFRVAAFCGLVVGPLLLSIGGLGWRYFPDDSQFAPLDRQAVVVYDGVALHADAARTAPEVIDAPPGSLCEIIRQTGQWSYVAFSNKVRGWVQTSSIETILPTSAPKPPDVRKPKADGSST